jgi:hypothetical protein
MGSPFLYDVEPALRVEAPELEIEVGGEAHPEEVREQQEARRWMEAPKSYESGQDGHPEGNNVYEGQSRALQTEEEVGPERVQSQLTEKQAQGANGVGQTVPAPNQPGGHSHHGVEQGPDRAKDPSGGRQGGLDQTAVPLPGLKPGTDPGGGEGDR